MTLTYVAGDPLQTEASILAFGYNALGRMEVTPFIAELLTKHPAAFAAFRKQCHAGKIKPGQYWLWRESAPRLMFMVVRASGVGATRLRYVQSVMMTIARDYRLEGIRDLAIAPLGNAYEWGEIKLVLETWLSRIDLPVTVYE